MCGGGRGAVLGEGRGSQGEGSQLKGLPFGYIKLASDQGEALLDGGRCAQTVRGGNGGRYVIDGGREPYAVELQEAQGYHKNHDEQKAGEGAPLFHTVCGSKDFSRGSSDMCCPELKHRLD